MMNQLLKDLRFALRMLAKVPLTTGFTVLILAVGLAVNTGIFSLVYEVLLRPPEGANVENCVVLGTFNKEWNSPSSLDLEHLEVIERESTLYQDLAKAQHFWLTLVGGAEPLRMEGGRVSPNLLSVLGVQPKLGENFRATDGSPEGDQAVFLSSEIWEYSFGGSPSVIGERVTVNGVSCIVRGILPDNFKLEAIDYSVLMASTFKEPAFEGVYEPWTIGVGLLNPGVSREQADAELKGLVPAMIEASDTTDFVSLVPEVRRMNEHFGFWIKQQAFMIQAAGILLLLICGFNVMTLLLIKMRRRDAEMGIRSALGATRGDLVRLTLVEHGLIGLASAVLGLVLGHFMLQGLLSEFSGASWGLLAHVNEVRLRWPVAALTAFLALLLVLLVGVGPVMMASQTRLSGALGDVSRGATSGKAFRRMCGALIVIEIGFTCVLIISSLLFMRSAQEVAHHDQGFQTENVAMAQLDLPFFNYAATDDPAILEKQAAMVEAVRQLPGVEAVIFQNGLPYWVGNTRIKTWAHRDVSNIEDLPTARLGSVHEDFIDVFQIKLIEGRKLTALDNQPGSPPVALVTPTFVERLAGGESALGRYLELPTMWVLGEAMVNQPIEIVGVINDIEAYWWDEKPQPVFFVPRVNGREHFHGFLMVRHRGPVEPILTEVRRIVHEIEPETVIRNSMALDTYLLKGAGSWRFMQAIQYGLGIIALVLSSIGIYGTVSYSIVQRHREMGIRMAMGATAGRIRTLVLWQSLWFIVGGLVLGGFVAWTAMPFLEGVLYEVAPRDPLSFSVTGVVVLLVAFAACLIPAWRASRLSPTHLLRQV